MIVDYEVPVTVRAWKLKSGAFAVENEGGDVTFTCEGATLTDALRKLLCELQADGMVCLARRHSGRGVRGPATNPNPG
jgi:hypothetical protein